MAENTVSVYYGEGLMRQYLDRMLPFVRHEDNARPHWLRGYEIDRYYPGLYLGFEFQGDQHYQRGPRGYTLHYTEFTYSGDRDKVKRGLYRNFGVVVVEVTARGLDSWWLGGAIRKGLWDSKHLALLTRAVLCVVLPVPWARLGDLDQAAALYRKRLLRRNPQSVTARTYDGRLSWWQKFWR